jgi:hypothetical protein
MFISILSILLSIHAAQADHNYPRPAPAPYPNYPTPNPSYDPLQYYRAGIQTTAYRLNESLIKFHTLAQRMAQVPKQVWDPHYGYRTVYVLDQNQVYALGQFGQARIAAGNFATFQARLNQCGPYEMNHGQCDRSVNTELQQFRLVRQNTRQAHQYVQQLAIIRTPVGQKLFQSITASVQALNQIYKQAGYQSGPNGPGYPY